jgi:hypothetical protein
MEGIRLLFLKRSDFPLLSYLELFWDAEGNDEDVTDLITPTLPHQHSNTTACA